VTARIRARLRSPFSRIDVAPLAVKVPEITLLFWAIKITSTAMGEALSDFLDGGPGIWPGVGAIVALTAFVVALRMQWRQTRYVTAIYWFAVAMVATFGTMAADALHQFLGSPYWLNSLFYAVVLAVVFVKWHRSEHTLSIHTVNTRRRERFYWATVFATFALGTATGDWTATDLHLGFFSSGLLFLGVIAIPAVIYGLKALNSILTFWFAYVITRPLGASFADWMDVSKHKGGLALGTGPVALMLAAVMTVLVLVLARQERGRLEPFDAEDEALLSGETATAAP
jgi:uncharacterized membrane-anchored protein